MTPIKYYQELIESDQILKDVQQEAIIHQLQIIFDQFFLSQKKSALLYKLMSKKPPLIPGIYLWGEVGIGKTFLLDCFFYCLPFKNKLRIHFHSFMKMVHEKLSLLQGEPLPILKLAKEIAKETKVICFDELVVNDIADAMLLASLFDALYKEKICLLFTSNSAPENLYLKGLQRDSFLPAINLIQKNSKVINVAIQHDYRLSNRHDNSFYYAPLDTQAQNNLEAQFSRASQNNPWTTQPLCIGERTVEIVKASQDVIWFEFKKICGVPRCQNDYIDIAKKFNTILISNVTAIAPEQNDLARSFINLIDVLYDANKKLIISAQKPIEQIYVCGRLLYEFARTRSRLIEMQTLVWHEKCDRLNQFRYNHTHG